MVTRTQPVAHVHPTTGIVTACSWCATPVQLQALAATYPAQVSHGLCPACLDQIAQAMTS